MLMLKNRGAAGPKAGFIQIIIAVVIIVLILTFFRFNLRSLVESPTGQSNFQYLGELVGRLWDWFWHWLGLFIDKIKQLAVDLTNR